MMTGTRLNEKLIEMVDDGPPLYVAGFGNLIHMDRKGTEDVVLSLATNACEDRGRVRASQGGGEGVTLRGGFTEKVETLVADSTAFEERFASDEAIVQLRVRLIRTP